MAGLRGYRPSEQNVRLHHERTSKFVVESDPLLDREMTLYWLQRYPEYREKIKRRVSEARQAATMLPANYACRGCGTDIRDGYTEGCRTCIERRSKRARRDVDHIGREVEGCG